VDEAEIDVEQELSGREVVPADRNLRDLAH
jgi:hypothetical protein